MFLFPGYKFLKRSLQVFSTCSRCGNFYERATKIVKWTPTKDCSYLVTNDKSHWGPPLVLRFQKPYWLKDFCFSKRTYINSLLPSAMANSQPLIIGESHTIFCPPFCHTPWGDLRDFYDYIMTLRPLQNQHLDEYLLRSGCCRELLSNWL